MLPAVNKKCCLSTATSARSSNISAYVEIPYGYGVHKVRRFVIQRRCIKVVYYIDDIVDGMCAVVM